MVWSFTQLDVLPEKQFSLWESLLEKRTGIQLAKSQQVLLQTQISIRMRELGISDYSEYLDYVQNETHGIAEWQVLVDRLVVKETTFFRHRPSIEFVRQLLKNRIQQQSSTNCQILSVGCSTGEEPYTLAATAYDCFLKAGLSPYFGVTAVDISLPSLSIARRGIYGQRSLVQVTEDERKRYFEASDKDGYRVNKVLRDRVCFAQLNVLDLKHKPLQSMDMIFCQNLLIYFRRWRRKEILNQLVSYLKVGGVLIIGLGEITDWDCPHVKRIDNHQVQAYMKYM